MGGQSSRSGCNACAARKSRACRKLRVDAVMAPTLQGPLLQRDLHRDELELRYRAIWRLEHASKEVPTGSGIAKTAVRGM
ncbi:MAG: hypothetical protein ACK55Z_37995, partial [bacterium]